MAFDVLHLDGRSTRAVPYGQRREILESLALDAPAWRTPAHWVRERDAVVIATRDQGLEGVVAKRLDSPYTAGKRSAHWIKQKHRRREQMVITGWVPSRPGQPESFLLARRRGAVLERAGSASFGLDAATREGLRRALGAHAQPQRRRNQRVRWGVAPAVVATVDFHGPLRGPVRDAVLRAIESP
jgi:bifunctional non-homologous end joining protein LigD